MITSEPSIKERFRKLLSIFRESKTFEDALGIMGFNNNEIFDSGYESDYDIDCDIDRVIESIHYNTIRLGICIIFLFFIFLNLFYKIFKYIN